jgi:hypothetical protein
MNSNYDKHKVVFSFFKMAIVVVACLLVLTIVYYYFSLKRIEVEEVEELNSQSFKFFDIKFIDNKETLSGKGFDCKDSLELKNACSRTFNNGLSAVVKFDEKNILNSIIYSKSYKDAQSCNQSINQMDNILKATNSATFNNKMIAETNKKVDESKSNGVIEELNENGKDVFYFNNTQKDGSFISNFIFSKE